MLKSRRQNKRSQAHEEIQQYLCWGKRIAILLILLNLFLIICFEYEVFGRCWVKFIQIPFWKHMGNESMWVNTMLGAVLSVLCGAAFAYGQQWAAQRYHRQNPARNLWQLGQPASCKVILSCTHDPVRPVKNARVAHRKTKNTSVASATPEKEGKNDKCGCDYYTYRYNTGEGQVRALPYLIASLRDAYGEEMDWNNLILAESPLASGIGVRKPCDMILVGGPVSNRFTRAILDKIKPRMELRPFDGSGVQVHLFGQEPSPFYRVERVEASPEYGNTVHKMKESVDYAVIVRLTTHFGRQLFRTYILAGCTTHGTALAAEYYCAQAMHEPLIRDLGNKDFVAVVTISGLMHGLMRGAPELRYLALLDDGVVLKSR